MLADDKRARNGITLVQNKSTFKCVLFMMVLSFLLLHFFWADIFHLGAREEGGASAGREGGGGCGVGLPRQGQHGRADAGCHWCSNSRGQRLSFQTPSRRRHESSGGRENSRPSFNTRRRTLASHGMTLIRRKGLGVELSPGSLTWLRRERVPIHSTGRRTFSN